MENRYISDSRLHIGANKAIKEAILGVIEDHKHTGRPMVIWRNGKIVKVAASHLLRRRV